MLKFVTTSVGRLRLYAFLEGLSLLLLVFIAVPLKYLYHNPSLVEILGSIHGGLFVLFVLKALHVGIQYKWKFFSTTWKVLLSSFIPFGTFYIDHKILRHL